MKIRKIIASACAMIMISAAGCAEGGDNSLTNKEKRSDVVIPVSEFAAALGAGWNLGNSLEANSGGKVNETAWGNPEVDQKIIDAVAAAGFRTVRVPISYLDKIDDNNEYKIDEKWLDRVNEVIDYCYNADLNVIINIHGDGYNTVTGGWLLCNGDDQESIRKKYGAVWKQLAEKFKDYDERLIFESMNEEFDGTYDDPDPVMYENINEYNRIFVETVRETGGNNTHRWLMVPGWNTNIDYTVGEYGFRLPQDTKNSADEGRLIVSVHYYDPWDYCGAEDTRKYLWGKRGSEIVEINKATPKALASWGDEIHMESQLKKLKESYVDNGIPVIVGEYGCIDKTYADLGIPNQIAENRAYWDGFFAGTAAIYGITPIYWDNGFNGENGFGLFDRNTCEQTQPEIISAIINAWESKNPETGLETRITRYY